MYLQHRTPVVLYEATRKQTVFKAPGRCNQQAYRGIFQTNEEGDFQGSARPIQVPNLCTARGTTLKEIPER